MLQRHDTCARACRASKAREENCGNEHLVLWSCWQEMSPEILDQNTPDLSMYLPMLKCCVCGVMAVRCCICNSPEDFRESGRPIRAPIVPAVLACVHYRRPTPAIVSYLYTKAGRFGQQAPCAALPNCILVELENV